MLEHSLSEEEVSQLTGRTKGWIAGLQLAALALRQREDHAAFLHTFTGSYRYLLDYVQKEPFWQSCPIRGSIVSSFSRILSL
jgi:LuxR family maltose regulon positive regulatory protein